MYYIYVTYFTLYIIWYCILLVSICSMFAFIYCQSSCRSPLKHIWEVPRTGTPNVTQILWTAPTQPPICGFVGALSPKCPSLAVLQCFALIDAYTPPTPDIISDAKKKGRPLFCGPKMSLVCTCNVPCLYFFLQQKDAFFSMFPFCDFPTKLLGKTRHQREGLSAWRSGKSIH